MKKDNVVALNKTEVLGKDFLIYGDVLEPLFLAKDVAEMLEHNQVARMIELVDEDEKLKCLVSTSGQSREMWFLTEDGLYEVLMQSRKPIAKAFKKEVKAIVKQLRQTGVVITESATEEAIDFESKYGKYRIRRTLAASTDLQAEYEQYMRLSQIERDKRRINNDRRIKDCKIIKQAVEDKIANEATTMKPSQILAHQELLLDIQKDITTMSNRANGGLKSAQTKKIQKLEQEIVKDDNNESEILELDWKTINNHGYTENLRLEYSPEKKRMVRTADYNKWLRDFDYSDFRPLNCDITRPMIIYLHFGKLAKFDTSNLEKSTIDVIADYYGFNDNLIVSIVTTSQIVDTYYDAFIMFDLINDEEE